MNQEVIKDFMRYAAAFEDAFAARDFGILGEHLAPDVDSKWCTPGIWNHGRWKGSCARSDSG